MVFPTKSTAAERIVISNAMWPIFSGLERASVLLSTCLNDYFGHYQQKAITESEAEWLSAMLHIVDTALDDAITSFKLTVTWKDGIEWLETAMDDHRMALEVEAVNDALSEMLSNTPADEREAISDEMERLGAVDDKAALPLLQKLAAKEGEKA